MLDLGRMDLQTRFVCVYSRAIQSGSIFDGAEKERATREANATRTARTNHTTVVRRFMATLAIRQGDVLFFARSLVWSITHMGNIDELDDVGRIERFQNLWEQRKRLVGRQLTQAELDELASQCRVKTVQLDTTTHHLTPAVQHIPFDQRPIG